MKKGPSQGWLLVALLLACLGCGGTAEESPPSEAAEPDPFDQAKKLWGERRYDEAADEFARLADRFKSSGDTYNQWRARLDGARALYRTARRDEAFDVIRLAGELTEGEVEREVQTAYWHAIFLHERGRLDEALEVAGRAQEWSARTDDPELFDRGHGVLATVYSLMGRYEDSLAINELLVDRFRRTHPDPARLARALNEIGIDYKHFGRFDDARAAYQEALEHFRKHGPERWTRIATFNLSNVYAELGDIESALALKLEALDLLEGVTDDYGLGLTLDGLGKTYGKAGNYEEARRYLDDAIDVGRRSNRPYVVLSALNGLASAELADGHPDRAKELAEEAITLADESGYGFGSVDARVQAVHAEVDLGHPDRALVHADEAVARAEQIGDPSLSLQALHARARALAASGRGEAAAEQYDSAIAMLETWRGRLEMGDLRMGMVEPRTYVYEDAIENLVALGRIEEAFALSERARARFLLELLADRRGLPFAEEGRERLLQRLRERYVASRGARSERLRAEYDREVDALIAELEADEARARRRDPVTAASLFPRPVPATDIRDALVSPARGVLSYFWGDRAVYGWWIGADGLRGRRLGNHETLAPTLDFLRASIDRPESTVDWRAAARRAYGQLVAPLAPGDVEELMVLPDGPLNLLPIEILIPDGSDVPWGAERTIVYGPSASVLAAQVIDYEEQGFDRAMLALGASSFERAPVDDVYRQGVALAPLPHAEDEARFIARLYDGNGATLLVGDDATRERWIGTGPDRFRYLHFATHAIVSDRRPELTHLVLADGALDLATIRRQRMRADLVTVSACESATGKRVRGEGIVGLPHAFLAAGARGAVVALWRVEDRSAADFMREFYRRLSDGAAPAEALRDLRKSWMSDRGERSHPSRWASFIQVGGIH